MAFDFDDSGRMVNTGSGFDFDEDGRPAGTVEKAEPRGIIRAVGDTALQFGKGAVSGVRMFSDTFGADNAVSGKLRNATEALDGLLSAAAQQDQRRVAEIMQEAEGKGWGEQIVIGLRAAGVAPGALLAQGLGTAAPTIAASLIPGVGQAGLIGRVGLSAGMGAAQGAGATKGAVYETTRAELINAGATEEEAEARAAAAQEYTGPNAGQIALGAGLGALAGSTGIERAAAALRSGVTKAPAGILGRVGTGAVTEAVPEFAQGGQEKFATNTALANEGFDVDPMSGVVASATMEGLAGAGLGAGFAIPKPRVQETPEAEPDKPLLLGNTPDPIIVFPDGTAGRRADLEAYINGLPEDQRVAARAKLMGMGARPATPEDILKAPDADSAINAFTASLTGTDMGSMLGQENPLLTASREMQAQAAADEAELSDLAQTETRDLNTLRAMAVEDARKQRELDALQATGTGQYGIPIEARPAVEAAATVEAPTALQLAMQRARERATPQPAATTVPVFEQSLAAAKQELPPTPERQPDILPGDISRNDGKPFQTENGARLKQREAGGIDGSEIVAVQNGFVVRPKATPTDPAAAAPGQAAGIQPAADGVPAAVDPTQFTNQPLTTEIQSAQTPEAQQSPPAGQTPAASPAPVPASIPDPVQPAEGGAVPAPAQDQRLIPVSQRTAPPEPKSGNATGLQATADQRLVPVSKRKPPEPIDLTDDETTAEFERLYQEDIKADIRQRLGMEPPAKEGKPKASAFRTFLRKHGISPQHASDITGERGIRANNRLPATFRRNGLGLDELALRAVEEGYLTDADLESDSDNGGTNKLMEMIQAEIRGERQETTREAGESAEAQMERVRQAELEDMATALGIPFDADIDPMALASMVARVQRALDASREPKGSIKADRVRLNAIAAAQRIEAKRQKYERELEEFAKADAVEQNAFLEVLMDEDGTPVVNRLADLEAEAAWNATLGTWSDQNESTRAEVAPARQAEAPDAQAAGQRPGDAQEGDSGQQRRSPEGQEEGLTAPTRADVLRQQDAADNAQALDDRAQIDREAGAQTLTAQTAPEQRRDTTGDIFGGPSPEEALAAKAREDEAKAKKKAAEDAASGQAGMFDAPVESDSSAQPSDAARAKEDLKSALSDLGNILTKGQRSNLMPEEEQKIMPVLVRVFDAAFRLGYANFKDAAKYALERIRETLGADVADSLTNRDMQDAHRASAAVRSNENDNRTAVVVGAKPGEFRWDFTAPTAPPPFALHPSAFPRLEKIGEATHTILKSSGFKKLVDDMFGVKGLEVAPLHASWEGKPEPSFGLYAPGLTFEQSDDMSKMLGMMLAQDATVVTQPTIEEAEDEIPVLYIGSTKKLTDSQLASVVKSAKELGVDYSTSLDGKAVKFLHFGDFESLEKLRIDASKIASDAGLGKPQLFYARSSLNESSTYTQERGGGVGGQAWHRDTPEGPSDLFRRAVDHVLVPYAKAVAAEGYTFSVQRYAERFGLSPAQQRVVSEALAPRNGASKATSSIMRLTDEQARRALMIPEKKANVSHVLMGLQNSSAQQGLIEPGDYSDKASKLIAQALTDEVLYHVNEHGGKSAIGWYDRALKAAKKAYMSVFPEISTDKNKSMLFDALLGIASQGNDVFSNSLFAGRMYVLLENGKTIPEAVKLLRGSFGGETRAIENNYLKLHELLERNGYDTMRAFFNKKATVGEINAILRSDTSLHYDGKPLQADGAARQTVTGWSVFGPKIGSFINNLHGDYSTLTADLWFSRTWNRILGYSFVHAPALEADQYQKFIKALVAESSYHAGTLSATEPKNYNKKGEPIYYEFGKDAVGMDDASILEVIDNPEAALALATKLEAKFRKGGYKEKSDLLRAAKVWVENRNTTVALPRTDNERTFQQETAERTQKMLKAKGLDISIADIQAALWYHEKDLFKKLGVSTKRSEAADYEDAAKKLVSTMAEGKLFWNEADERKVLDDTNIVYKRGAEPQDNAGGTTAFARGAGTRGDVTQTPAFKSWFKNSKVVNPDGSPMVVYHGTTRGNFTVFDRMKSTEWRRPSMDTVGSWFSDNPSEDGGAGVYSAGGESTIYPVYLSIQNPKRYRTFNDFLRHMHRAAGRKMEDQPAPGRGSTEELRAELKADGYDGIEFEQTANESLMQDVMDMAAAVERARKDEFSVRRSEREAYTIKRERLEQTLKSMRKELNEFGSSTEFDKQRVFIAFRPEQIKSATGNRGTFDPANPDIRFARSRPFYSALSREIEGINAKAMTPGDWGIRITGLIKAGKVKADEVEWSGLTEFLKLQTGKVTKEQVTQYLDANGVRVEETVLGETGLNVDGNLEVGQNNDGEFAVFTEDGSAVGGTYRTEAEANEALDSMLADAPTKYGSGNLVLPGGTNYREVLLTLPAKSTADPARAEYEAWAQRNGLTPNATFTEERYKRETGNDAPAPRTMTAMKADAAQNFQSSHWGQPNVLAHIRVNDRTDADGKKVLFVEEVQSDWGQQGKKTGFYDAKAAAAAKEKLESFKQDMDRRYGEQWGIVDDEGRLVDRLRGTERQARMLAEEYNGGYGPMRADLRLEPGVAMARELGVLLEYERLQIAAESPRQTPAAPFVTKTDAWLSLALKRIVKMAVDEGYDRVAFVNGDQSAERYDLSKQVKSISWINDTMAGGRIVTIKPQGQADIDLRVTDDGAVGGKNFAGGAGGDFTGKKLADVIGKDLAEKVMATKSGKLTGLDLKVGGEGMKAFYDKIVPNTLKDVLRKVGGGALETVTMPMAGRPSGDFGSADLDAVREFHDISPAVWSQATRQEQNAMIREYFAEGEVEGSASQPGFTITDAMREKAAGGLPMFDRNADLAQLEALLRAVAPGRSETAASVRDMVSPLSDKWNIPVTVVQRPDQLPVPAPSDARGMYHNGAIYLVASNLNSRAAVMRTLGHEAIAHHGLREMLGDEGFSAMMRQINLAVKAGNPAMRKISEYVRRTYVDENGKFELTPEQEADEIAARAVEDGIDPESGEFRPGFGWLKGVFARVVQFLRDLGITVPMSNTELQGVLVNSMRGLEAGAKLQGQNSVMAAARSGTPQNEVKDAIQRWTGADVSKAAPEMVKARALKELRAALSNDKMPPEDMHKLAYNWLAKSYEYAPASGKFGDPSAPSAVVTAMRESIIKRAREGKKHDAIALPWGKKFTVVIDGRVFGAYETMAEAEEEASYMDSEFWRGEIFDEDGNDTGNYPRWTEKPSVTAFARSAVTGQTIAATWQAPDPTRMDDMLYSMQDKHIDTRRVVTAVRDAIGGIADNLDPYLQEELYHGRAAMATKEFLEKSIRPLLTDMQARGVEMSDFEEYLHNRHAERRNEQVAKVNPNMPDGGSGIKTADARAYLSGLPAAKRTAYQALAKRVDQLNRETRSLLVSSGLEKQSTIDAWQAAYGDEYVPLMREEMDNGMMGIGQGFSVRGGSSKRAMGSNKPVANILANIALQREKAITRAEKRRIGEALYGMVLSAPNPDFWFAVDPALQQDPAQITATAMQLVSMGMNPIDAEQIVAEPTQRYIDPRTGQVASRINPALRSAQNVLAVRIDGEDKYVFFNAKDERAMRMAKSLKSLDSDQLGVVMGNVAKVTRYFSAINTQYNPIFGVVNLTRDIQTALLNLQSTRLAGKQADVMKHVGSALRGIYIDLRDHRAGKTPTSTWASLFEEFQREGGATGYRDMYANAQERADAITSELKKIKQGKAMEFGRGVFGWLSDYNDSMENAVRLATYKVAKEQGMSNQQAASIAKNLTVNFNRKGQVALQAGALYAFFNAAVQGTTRMAETMFSGGKLSSTGKKIMTGGLLIGSMQALLLAAAGYDDEEPPDFVRERSLVLPIGGDKYISIPMPLGFHVIPNLARIPTEWAMGGFRDTPKRLAQLVSLFADAFNPIGSAGLSLQTLAPTVIDPLAALAENRDWTGKPIAKKDFNSMQPTAGHTRAKDTATPWARAIAYGVNWVTGGTDYKPGMASPTPDQIDYLIGQVTGGVGREVSKMSQVASSTVSGEELPLYKIPLLGRFVGTTAGQAAESGRFYENLKQIGEHDAELSGLKKDRRMAEYQEYLRDNPQGRLVPIADRTYREVSKLIRMKRDALKAGASTERIKMLDQQITARMAAFNQRVKATETRETATPE